MGTNYYMAVNACPHCHRSESELHIGKSSAGWCFSLNTHPDNGIESLDDWRAAWANNGIRDEYDRSISAEEMERTILNRVWKGAEPQRQQVDGRHCIAHGDGSYDIMRGDFS